MAKKVPGYFRKQLTEKQLRYKYLKHIAQHDDKTFIRSCYNTEAEGDFLEIRKDLSDSEIKRLAGLKKSIKENRKLKLRFLPLIITGALAAGILFFFTVLANPLLQRAAETGLEAVFEARVNAERFRISLINFEIAMDSLTIADRDRPMQNLIELSAIRLKLKPEAVMRGKIYIEEIRADNIRLGTPRTVSGSLPGKPPREIEPREPFTVPPLVDLQNFDPIALLNQEYDRLLTPRLYDLAIETYDAALARWKGEQEAARARVSEIQNMALPLLAINAADFRTLDANTVSQIRTHINDVNTMIAAVQTVQDDVLRIAVGLGDDINSARLLEQNARDAISTDLARFRSFLDPGSGALMEILEPVLRDLLTEQAEGFLAYGERALEILGRIRETHADIPAELASHVPDRIARHLPRPSREEVFRGRDVDFPTLQFPRFYLGNLATDLLMPNALHWALELGGVSSNPNLSGTPTSLAFSLAETAGAGETANGLKRSGAFRGQADFRSNLQELTTAMPGNSPAARFIAEFSGGGFPVDITAALEKIGIGGFSGGAAFDFNLTGNVGGGFSVGGGISLSQASLRDPANTFARAASEAIQHVGTVELGLVFERVADGSDRFSINTNFDSIFRDVFTRLVSQYVRQAEEALERALRSKIEQYIDGRFVSREDLDLALLAIRGDNNAMNELRSSLENKRDELENRLRAAADDVVDQAQQAAQQAAEQALQDLRDGRLPAAPVLPTPALPGLPGLPRR